MIDAHKRGIGTRLLAGAWAGVLAGVLFGAVMPAEEMMPMVAVLYGLDGIAAGWALHLVHSAVFGVLFAAVATVALRGRGEQPVVAPLPAALFGFLLWLVAASFVMPAWIGAVTEMAPPVPDWNWLSLVGHLVYGIALGVLYATTARIAWTASAAPAPEQADGTGAIDGGASASAERTRPQRGPGHALEPNRPKAGDRRDLEAGARVRAGLHPPPCANVRGRIRPSAERVEQVARTRARRRCAMRDELAVGRRFPDLVLPEHTGAELSLAAIADGQPLVLCFARGWWCPKEQVRLRGLVSMQEEIQREYGRIAVVTVDEPYVNGAFRAGLGAAFPFLSDDDRRVAGELDLLELTDEKHRPYLPFTFVLDSTLCIHGIWCGFWYWGNPTPDELRLALREITRAEQPTLAPQSVWAQGGSAPAEAGIAGEAIWVREDSQGRELARGVHHGEIPSPGDELGRSSVDGRTWIVHEVEGRDGRVAIHVRKRGAPGPARLVRHHFTAPPAGR